MQYYLIFPKHRDETLVLADLTPEKKRILAICLTIVNAVPWIFMVYVAFTMGLFEQHKNLTFLPFKISRWERFCEYLIEVVFHN